MKVTVLEDVCTGCGLCVSDAPDVFEVPESVAKVKVNPVPAALEESAKLAAADCPVEAIKVE
ncbi:MAG: ferredoxin [Elusimicrobia bacterium HGW-Elusimicrobia-1]|jgi:ferredoxin|nr:MAG: ferredoxin [Elusimicrobia bacterium HGW-Elusimicrobia-1]